MLRTLVFFSILAFLLLPDWATAIGRRRGFLRPQQACVPAHFAPIAAPYQAAPVVYASTPTYIPGTVIVSAPVPVVHCGMPVVTTTPSVRVIQGEVVPSEPTVPSQPTITPVTAKPAEAPAPSEPEPTKPVVKPEVVQPLTPPESIPSIGAPEPLKPLLTPELPKIPAESANPAPSTAPAVPASAPAALPALPKIDLGNLNGQKSEPASPIVPVGGITNPSEIPNIPPQAVPSPAPQTAPTIPAVPTAAAIRSEPAPLPKLDFPKLEIPAKPDAPAPLVIPTVPGNSSTSRSSPLNAENRFEIFPIAGLPPQSPAEERTVRFFNLSSHEVKLDVNGTTGSLPSQSVVSLKLAQEFSWTLDGVPRKSVVPLTAPGIEVVIRK